MARKVDHAVSAATDFLDEIEVQPFSVTLCRARSEGALHTPKLA